MSSEVDISNNALALLGDTATVVSLSPPSGSVQAGHCARFYPMARDAVLEMHTWSFATKRASLPLLAASPPSGWAYAYKAPSDVANFLAILDPNAPDDYSAGLSQYGNTDLGLHEVGIYTPQPFVVEIDANDNQVIYTNQQNAVLRYTAQVTDTTQFSALFEEALTWYLASKLAGPIIKGSEGRATSLNCLKEFQAIVGQAMASDANARRVQPAQNVSWIANR